MNERLRPLTPGEAADARQKYLKLDRRAKQVIGLLACFVISSRIYDSFLRTGARAEKAALCASRVNILLCSTTTERLDLSITELERLTEWSSNQTRSAVLSDLARLAIALRNDDFFEVSSELFQRESTLSTQMTLKFLEDVAAVEDWGGHHLVHLLGGSSFVLLMPYLLAESTPWQVWRRLISAVLQQSFSAWGLLYDIAFISDEIWEAGAEAVAEEIRRLQLEFVAHALPQVGALAFDEEEGLFRKVVAEVARPPLLGATLAQVEGALEDVLADPSNGLHDRSREVQVLTRMLERFSNDPQRIEMDCTSVYGSLTRQLASEELPPSEQNLALREAVTQIAEGIRATDPEIAENRRILSDVKLRDMGEEELVALEEALPVLEAVSDADLGEEFREDVLVLSETLRLPDRPVLGTEERNPGLRAAYDEEIRLFKRIADMAIIMRSAEIVHKLDGTATVKGLKIVGTLLGLIAFIIALF